MKAQQNRLIIFDDVTISSFSSDWVEISLPISEETPILVTKINVTNLDNGNASIVTVRKSGIKDNVNYEHHKRIQLASLQSSEMLQGSKLLIKFGEKLEIKTAGYGQDAQVNVIYAILYGNN